MTAPIKVMVDPDACWSIRQSGVAADTVSLQALTANPNRQVIMYLPTRLPADRLVAVLWGWAILYMPLLSPRSIRFEGERTADPARASGAGFRKRPKARRDLCDRIDVKIPDLGHRCFVVAS